MRTRGAFLSKEFELLKIFLRPCRNESSNITSKVDINILFVTSYFDYSDLYNSIKKFIEDRIYVPIEP